jgi:hydrogenase expression/formation protein HypE
MATPAEPLHAELFDSCPLPHGHYDRVLLGHGSGGRLTADLIQRLFVPGFGNEVLTALEDQAIVSLSGNNGAAAPRIAFTTDSFVVRPLFFPGGDIGRLAVHGTVNDLAVGGARPLFLSAAFILEEGLALADLQRIVSVDACGLRGCRRNACHGGYQSCRPGKRGPDFHHYLRNRPGSRWTIAVDPCGKAW